MPKNLNSLSIRSSCVAFIGVSVLLVMFSACNSTSSSSDNKRSLPPTEILIAPDSLPVVLILSSDYEDVLISDGNSVIRGVRGRSSRHNTVS